MRPGALGNYEDIIGYLVTNPGMRTGKTANDPVTTKANTMLNLLT